MRRFQWVLAAVAVLTLALAPGCSKKSSSRGAPAPLPMVVTISPSASPDTAPTPVTIIGTGFVGAVTAWLEDPATTTLTGLAVGSATQLTATVPAGVALGTWEVRVAADAGTSALAGVTFTVTAPLPPTVTGITPNAGPRANPTPVTIDGTNFVGTVTARLDDPATTALTGVSVGSPSQLTAVVPSGIDLGTWEVRVTADGGTSPIAGVTFDVTSTPPPTVTGITPNLGSAATPTPVTINGTVFVGTVTARLDDPATTALTGVVVGSLSQLTATVPAGVAVGTWEVRVTADGGTSPVAGVTFDVTGTYTGPAIYITQSNSDNVLVVNLNTRLAELTIPVGVSPSDIAISPDESKVYVTNTTSGTVSIIDTATNTVSGSITVGGGPAAVDFSPSGLEAYVANSTTINVSVIDATTDTWVVDIPVAAAPGELEFRRPQGDEVWVLCSGPSPVDSIADPVDVIDPDPLVRSVTTSIPGVGVTPTGIAFDQAGNTVFVTNSIAVGIYPAGCI